MSIFLKNLVNASAGPPGVLAAPMIPELEGRKPTISTIGIPSLTAPDYYHAAALTTDQLALDKPFVGIETATPGCPAGSK